MTHTREFVLATITAGPVRFSALAGSKARPVRMSLRVIVDALTAEGLIRQVYIDRFPYYVASDWELSDEERVKIIYGRCKPVHGCMVWTGYVDPRRGPVARIGKDEPPISARRMVWQSKRKALDYQQTVRMRDDCEANCIEYSHMRLGRREDAAKGRTQSLPTRQRMAEVFQRNRAKLDWDKVRAIRASTEKEAVLALRYGVSKPTIGQVRRGETWHEYRQGMFTGLITGRRAA